jgi:hypothetical protein
MRHPTEFRRLRTNAMPSQRCQRPLGKPQVSLDLRSEAEAMLREMAFVLHVTRTAGSRSRPARAIRA